MNHSKKALFAGLEGMREGERGYQSLGSKVLAGLEQEWMLSNRSWDHEGDTTTAEEAAQSIQRQKYSGVCLPPINFPRLSDNDQS